MGQGARSRPRQNISDRSRSHHHSNRHRQAGATVRSRSPQIGPWTLRRIPRWLCALVAHKPGSRPRKRSSAGVCQICVCRSGNDTRRLACSAFPRDGGFPGVTVDSPSCAVWRRQSYTDSHGGFTEFTRPWAGSQEAGLEFMRHARGSPEERLMSRATRRTENTWCCEK